MKYMVLIAILACATLIVTGAAQAEVTLNSVRLGAANVEALTKFYQSAFGLKEVNRIQAPGGPELFLNFGPTVDSAKANKAAQIVIMHRDSDAIKDPVPHLIFNVTDMTATVAAIKAAGGTMQREPFPFGNSGITIGIAIDPAGNLLELIQRR